MAGGREAGYEPTADEWAALVRAAGRAARRLAAGMAAGRGERAQHAEDLAAEAVARLVPVARRFDPAGGPFAAFAAARAAYAVRDALRATGPRNRAGNTRRPAALRLTPGGTLPPVPPGAAGLPPAGPEAVGPAAPGRPAAADAAIDVAAMLAALPARDRRVWRRVLGGDDLKAAARAEGYSAWWAYVVGLHRAVRAYHGLPMPAVGRPPGGRREPPAAAGDAPGGRG